MNRDTFSGLHPIVSFLYFMAVLACSMILTHPVCLAISTASAFAYAVYLTGAKAVKFSLAVLLPMILLAALMNPAFNHQGGTILTYLPDGNPLTLESIAYGVASAVMMAAVITWFSCFNQVMTSDKFVYLFGRVIPALSLILAMALRFVPRFRDQIKIISNAQKCVGRDLTNGNIFQKMRHGVRILSIMVTWALENAIESADSMKARGYGLPGRTAFSIYRFDSRDRNILTAILACVGVVVAGSFTGVYHFRYFPTIKGNWTGASFIVFAAYLLLGMMPLIVNIKEDMVWKSIRSTI